MDDKYMEQLREDYNDLSSWGSQMKGEFLTFEEYVKIRTGSCYYTGKTNTTLYIARLRWDVGFTKENTVSICPSVSYMKREMNNSEFIAIIKSIYEREQERTQQNQQH